MKSTLFSLKTRDFLKGLIMFVGTPLLYFIQEAIPGYNIPPVAKIAISAAVTYLIKNFFTNDVAVAQKTLVEAREKEVEETLKQ